jgi:hypothetical protein
MDALPEKLGLSYLRPRQGQASLSQIAGMVVRAVILLITAQQATATLELTQLAGMIGEVVTVAVGAVFGGVALALGLAFVLGGRDRAKQIVDMAGSAQTR